jgi:glycosyltransferase involved in cell wall biosynthesis
LHYDTSLRPYTAKRIEEIDHADILVGIPCYYNDTTIEHVIQMVSHGLHDHYKDARSVIMIADGGSTDDTREVAKDFQIKPWQEKLISIYRGPAGKGSALRSIFEAAARLNVSACMVVDSDLRSITGEWVRLLMEPVLQQGSDFVTPIYTRYKYDGTITNNITYNLTRALYGKRIRQPIGGDFAFSLKAVHLFLSQNVWSTDVARFGIDIWLTTNAVIHDFKICQSHLGVKIHDAKDPASHLAAMFRQVIGTLFSLMEQYASYWKAVKGSTTTEIFGSPPAGVIPEAIVVDQELLVNRFKAGYRNFGVLYEKIFTPECFRMIRQAAQYPAAQFFFETDPWVRTLYELAATFHKWTHNRHRLLEIAIPLYYGRVASFINRTREMNSAEAEEVVEEQAIKFENGKDYLIQLWDEPYQEDDLLDNTLREV